MKAKKTIKRIVVIILILLSLCMIWSAAINIKRIIDLSINIDRENLLEYVIFDGEISDWQKNQIENMLEKVDSESLNYIVNSGGKIIVTYNKQMDVRKYLDQHYGYDLMKTTFTKIQGVTIPYRDIFGNLYKVDVVIACGDIAIGELIHEFGHVYDITHGNVSKKPEFQEIYNNRENINNTVLYQVHMYIDYYSSNKQEYFAELYKQYLRGKFETGKKSEEKEYLIEYFDGLSLQR